MHSGPELPNLRSGHLVADEVAAIRHHVPHLYKRSPGPLRYLYGVAVWFYKQRTKRRTCSTEQFKYPALLSTFGDTQYLLSTAIYLKNLAEQIALLTSNNVTDLHADCH